MLEISDTPYWLSSTVNENYMIEKQVYFSCPFTPYWLSYIVNEEQINVQLYEKH
jgi:hypothetical protein